MGQPPRRRRRRGHARHETIGRRVHERHERPHTWRYFQADAEWLYQHIYVQVGVAILIFANFIANIIEAQIAINGNTAYEVSIFAGMELFFFWIFLFELLLNMYSAWFWKF